MDPWVAQFEFVVEGFLLRLFLISFLGAEVDILYDYDWIVGPDIPVTRELNGWRRVVFDKYFRLNSNICNKLT